VAEDPRVPIEPEAPSGTTGKGILDPAVLDKLSSLALVARKVVEGFMSGHTSPTAGARSSSRSCRPYSPGDELKRIDWKVFAKAGDSW
jgi:uncharacterized protein (DUF58 family)